MGISKIRAEINKISSLDDIEKVEKLMKMRKEYIEGLGYLVGEAVLLHFPGKHLLAIKNGQRVKIKSVSNNQYTVEIDGNDRAFPKEFLRKLK